MNIKRTKTVHRKVLKFAKPGLKAITHERFGQIVYRGFTVQKDAENYPTGQLVDFAGCILTPSLPVPDYLDEGILNYISKVREKSYKERLAIAGALIAAEIDRISL